MGGTAGMVAPQCEQNRAVRGIPNPHCWQKTGIDFSSKAGFRF
jgi:hypothetical protein